MEQYIIKGGNPLVGEVEIGGAKNAALGILAAAIMADEPVLIENLPDVNDINVMLEAIEGIGAMVQRIDRHTVKINGNTIGDFSIDYDYIKKIRASYYLLGALLGRCKNVEVGLPGGCNLGARPIDQHIKGFELLGAKVTVGQGKITAKVDELTGNSVYFDVVSVGATINLILAAVLAKGTTVLDNVAKEPHIVDVANFLNTAGADIRGAGTDTIKINGVSHLQGNHTYSIVPDQIEAGTFMLAAVASKGNILIKNCIPEHLESLSAKILEIGGKIEDYGDSLRVSCNSDLQPTNIKTLPYPGFPTDLQPQMGVVLSIAKGTSLISESIWESRFQYTNELIKMGAKITAHGKTAVFEGVDKLTSAPLYATDLRAGAALLVAAIIADGTSELYNIHYIDRGYEHIEDKFRKLGATIERVTEE